MTSQNILGWIFTAFSCLIAIISFFTTTIWLAYGIWNRIHNISPKIAKKLLITNWGAAISFAITTASQCVHSIQMLADSLKTDTETQFVSDFEAEDLQFSLLLSSFFYLIGKFLLYFVFYLRLFYLLKGSIFAYENKYYFRIKCLIGLTCLCAFLIIPTAMVNNASFESLSNLFAIVFLLCDIGVPIMLNVMFIKKMHEIQTFIAVKVLPERYQPQSPRSPSVPSTNAHKAHVDVDTDTDRDRQSDRDGASSGSELSPRPMSSSSQLAVNVAMDKFKDKNYRIDKSVSLELESGTQTPTASKSKVSHGDYNHNFSYKQRSISSINVDRDQLKKKRENEKLLVLITRLGLLSSVIMISSLIFLGIVAVYTVVKDSSSVIVPVLWVSMAADGCINTVCLILYFNFASSMYKLLCCCCTTKCVSTVLPKCLCKCCK